MAEGSLEGSISLSDLEVGVAYSGIEHLNEDFSGPSWQRGIAEELEPIVKPQSLHVETIFSG